MADAGRLTPQKPHTNGDAASDAQQAKQSADAGKPAFKVTFERPETREALKANELKSTEFKATELKASELKSPEMAGGKAALAHVALVPEPAPANSYGGDAAPSKDAKGQNAPVPDSKSPESKNLDAKAGTASSLLGNPDTSSAHTGSVITTAATSPREIPSTTQMLTAPLLAIVAALSLLAAGWTYAKLNETRAQLASATEALTTVVADRAAASQAKAAAEKAIAAASAEMANAAQVKTAAEKALADAKVRLSSVEKTVTEMKAALAAITTVAAPAGKPADTPAATDAPPAK